MESSTLPFPFANAMDVKNQVLFLIILASFTHGKLANADLHSIASQLKVTHHNCGEMTENNLYTLNLVSKCNIAPENLEVSRAKITMYTKHFRQKSTQQFVESNSRVISFRRLTREPLTTLMNFNFFPHSKMISKTENFLLDNTLYLEIKFTDLLDPEGATPSSINSWFFYRTPQSFFYPVNPGELSRYS